MIEKAKLILEKEASAIRNIPLDGNFEKAIGIIYDHVHTRGGKLVTSGMGKAGQIAHNIATTFSSTGTPAIFLHPSEAQHGDLGILQENDVLLAISNSGKTREITELIDLKNNLFSSIPVIVITGNPGSPLGLMADCTLSTGGPEEVCPIGLTPTTSTTVMTALGDAMVVIMMEKIGFTALDYAHRHHGGYLGAKSRAISDNGKS